LGKRKRFMISIVAIIILLVGTVVIVAVRYPEAKKEIGQTALANTESKNVKDSTVSNPLTENEEVINTENNPDNSDNDINNKIDTNKSELELPEKIEKDSVSNNDTKEKVKKKESEKQTKTESKQNTQHKKPPTTPPAPVVKPTKYVKVGSTDAEVKSIMGKPTKIESLYFLKYEYWYNGSAV